jgi:hypothetical protein
MMGRRARYALVQIPNGMWSTDQWCIMPGNVFKPSGSQWLQIQWGWSYPERFKWLNQVNGTPGWVLRVQVAMPNIPADKANGDKPALTGQFGHIAADEVLNTATNPITGQPEKNFTRLDVGVNCYIPQMESGSAFQKRTFYTITDNGGTGTGPSRATVTASANWVPVMTASGPVFQQQNI